MIGPAQSTGIIYAPTERNLLTELEAAARFYRVLLET
jgi:hypothetical protein